MTGPDGVLGSGRRRARRNRKLPQGPALCNLAPRRLAFNPLRRIKASKPTAPVRPTCGGRRSAEAEPPQSPLELTRVPSSAD